MLQLKAAKRRRLETKCGVESKTQKTKSKQDVKFVAVDRLRFENLLKRNRFKKEIRRKERIRIRRRDRGGDGKVKKKEERKQIQSLINKSDGYELVSKNPRLHITFQSYFFQMNGRINLFTNSNSKDKILIFYLLKITLSHSYKFKIEIKYLFILFFLNISFVLCIVVKSKN